MLYFEQAGENLTRRYKRKESVERLNGKTIPEIKELLNANKI